ncbi:MAG TPA: rRNA maturation RNase YbeY [Dissulfurispiraceae bacterium]|nr:rRNA maturation RNase YbeY [Dissulfurispiraceae bacterium]
MEIAVKNSQRSIKADPLRIRRTIAAALMRLSGRRRVRGVNLSAGVSFDPSEASVSVMLVGDRKMRELNHAYRGVDRTTDVLSFSQLEGMTVEQAITELGDIVISPAQAARQAAESGNDFDSEMQRLLVHGLLHLIGYDHEIDRHNAMKMKKKEKELLDALKKMG